MAESMPSLQIQTEDLLKWGKLWKATVNPETNKAKESGALDRQQSVRFAKTVDRAFADSLAAMLGGVPVVETDSRALVPSSGNCVEMGAVRVIGGVRPQNFDVAYRPDGLRVAFDSKTLNDRKSIGKNWQNMINDLATEATTVHTRFPYAVVAFVVLLPRPALVIQQELDIVRTLERLGTRRTVLNQAQLAEAISLVIWDPDTGLIDAASPSPTSPLRIDRFPETFYPRYVERYKGLPPHNVSED
jgi:hypothetical protein